MANLAEEARDLAAEQQRWNEEVARADSARAAGRQEALAERADSLAAGLHDAAQELERMDAPEPVRSGSIPWRKRRSRRRPP